MNLHPHELEALKAGRLSILIRPTHRHEPPQAPTEHSAADCTFAVQSVRRVWACNLEPKAFSLIGFAFFQEQGYPVETRYGKAQTYARKTWHSYFEYLTSKKNRGNLLRYFAIEIKLRSITVKAI